MRKINYNYFYRGSLKMLNVVDLFSGAGGLTFGFYYKIKRTIIKSFPTVEFPNDVILEEEHKTINDYMDSTIMKYWNIYVTQKLPGYIYK